MQNESRQESQSTETPKCNVAPQIDVLRFETAALDVLKSKGFRVTMPRVQVIRALASTRAALAPQSIHERILATGGRIDLVSVYRILTTLVEVGLVHHIGIVDGYFACTHEHASPHVAQHMVCQRCGCVSEVQVPETAGRKIEEVAARVGFTVSDLRIELLGLCPHCQS